MDGWSWVPKFRGHALGLWKCQQTNCIVTDAIVIKNNYIEISFWCSDLLNGSSMHFSGKFHHYSMFYLFVANKLAHIVQQLLLRITEPFNYLCLNLRWSSFFHSSILSIIPLFPLFPLLVMVFLLSITKWSLWSPMTTN